MNPSDRGYSTNSNDKYDKPIISSRGLVVNNREDSVQRYLSNAVSKPNPQNNNYKGPAISPDAEFFRDSGTGINRERQYNYFTQPEDEYAWNNDLRYKLQKEDMNRKISDRRASIPQNAEFYKDTGLGVNREKDYNYFTTQEDELWNNDLRSNLQKEDMNRRISDRRTVDSTKLYTKSVDGYANQFPDGSNIHEDSVNMITDVASDDPRKDMKFKEILNANKIYSRKEIQWYDRFNRFGFLDPYNGLQNTREYLFFTKPDLHILNPGTESQLYSEFENSSFFQDVLYRYPQVLYQLQSSAGPSEERANPFMCLLSNTVNNTLDLPSITAREIETSANAYGTYIPYRGSGYKSDENAEVSLEFIDSKFSEVYMMTRIYEEYSRIKDLGSVTPPNIGVNGSAIESDENNLIFAYSRYHMYRELHDRFSIYKIIVDEDYETILFWAKCIGCYFNTVPRDAFSDLRDTGGLKYTIDIKVPFVRDMNPIDLYGFNSLISRKRYSGNKPPSANLMPIYKDPVNGMGSGYIDGEWALTPYIQIQRKEDSKQWLAPQSMEYMYKLKWYK